MMKLLAQIGFSFDHDKEKRYAPFGSDDGAYRISFKDAVGKDSYMYAQILPKTAGASRALASTQLHHQGAVLRLFKELVFLLQKRDYAPAINYHRLTIFKALVED